MADLKLSPTRKHYRIGDKGDYVVLDGGRVIGRIVLHPQASEGRPWFWTITAPDISALARQAGLLSNARGSDGSFQNAMAQGLVRIAADKDIFERRGSDTIGVHRSLL